MSVCLQQLQEGRGLGKSGSREDEEVAEHQVRASVQMRSWIWGLERRPGSWKYILVLQSSVCSTYMPGRSQTLFNSCPGDLMLSSTLLGHLHSHVHTYTHAFKKNQFFLKLDFNSRTVGKTLRRS